MKVAVVGAGAMGSVYGAAFHDAGNDTSLIDANKALVHEVRTNGLRIERRDGTAQTYQLPITDRPDAERPGHVDLVVFLVKGYATAGAAELARPVVGQGTILLTLQNGLGNEEVLRSAFPANALLIGNSVHSATALGPGHVSHTGVRETALGPANDGWADQARRAVGALEPSGFVVDVLDEPGIRHRIWSKFVMNCGSLPVTALTGLATAELAVQEPSLRLVDEIVRETCGIAAAEGIRLEAEERVAFSRELFRTAGGKGSMLQDIEAGRRTEIDTINGAAVAVADRHGLAAPLNRAMVALVHGREGAMGIRP